MIYGRFGGRMTIQRMARLSDVKELDGRKPDKQDKAALAADSYVVVSDDAGKLRLYHLSFLKADGGWAEISAVVMAVKANSGIAP